MFRYSTAVLVVFGFVATPASGQLGDFLKITEVMSNSSHPGSNALNEGGHANGDWFELFNASESSINMGGFQWDDDNQLSDPSGVSVFPDNFFIEPGEAVLIVQEDDSTFGFADGFRASWNIPDSVRILGRDTFDASGPEKFSGLASGGDEINLYDPSGTLIQSVAFGAATEGFSTTWGYDNGVFTDFGTATVGSQGAYAAVSDGSNGRLQRDENGALVRDANGNTLVDPNSTYVPPSLDVGSPGIVFGFGDVVELTVPEICALVPSGERTNEDVDAALAAIGSLRGDVDLDGKVDFSDFLLHSSSFGQTIIGSMGGWGQGDFNCDGSVEFGDFLQLASNFGKTGPTATASVPEPDSMVLGLLALLGIAAIRTRRVSRR